MISLLSLSNELLREQRQNFETGNAEKEKMDLRKSYERRVRSCFSYMDDPREAQFALEITEDPMLLQEVFLKKKPMLLKSCDCGYKTKPLDIS